jgi:hypothetical protein
MIRGHYEILLCPAEDFPGFCLRDTWELGMSAAEFARQLDVPTNRGRIQQSGTSVLLVPAREASLAYSSKYVHRRCLEKRCGPAK